MAGLNLVVEGRVSKKAEGDMAKDLDQKNCSGDLNSPEFEIRSLLRYLMHVPIFHWSGYLSYISYSQRPSFPPGPPPSLIPRIKHHADIFGKKEI